MISILIIELETSIAGTDGIALIASILGIVQEHSMAIAGIVGTAHMVSILGIDGTMASILSTVDSVEVLQELVSQELDLAVVMLVLHLGVLVIPTIL